jgi:hypothetical protein
MQKSWRCNRTVFRTISSVSSLSLFIMDFSPEKATLSAKVVGFFAKVVVFFAKLGLDKRFLFVLIFLSL